MIQGRPIRQNFGLIDPDLHEIRRQRCRENEGAVTRPVVIIYETYGLVDLPCSIDQCSAAGPGLVFRYDRVAIVALTLNNEVWKVNALANLQPGV